MQTADAPLVLPLFLATTKYVFNTDNNENAARKQIHILYFPMPALIQ